MAEFNNENSGALFKNDRKTDEKHPDFKGSLDVGGVDHWVSAWKKTSKDGKAYLSISVTKKDEQKGAAKPTGRKPAPPQEDDLGI